MLTQDCIKIRGARVHNLKNVSLDIPKNKLVVITGLSGSGKSSLAFDTLYAEGQRRYVESLSAYARQFLGVMDKPDVDSIDGLSPAISIDQKSVSKNPRSTVGTITEIYDYLRLLFARAGQPYCPKCDRVVSRQNVSQITDQILKKPKKTQMIILAPLIRDQKGEHKNIIKKMSDSGYARVRVDGEVYKVEEALKLNLEKYKRHSVEAVIDRLTIESVSSDDRARVAESVEQALKLGDGLMIVQHQVLDKKPADELFSESLSCAYCGLNFPAIEPRSFSFNSPHGACTHCTGLGHTLEIDPNLVFPNKNLTLAEGAIRPWSAASHRVGYQGWYWSIIDELSKSLDFPVDIPVKDLPDYVIDVILYGANSSKLKTKNLELETDFEGVIPNLLRRYKGTESDFTRAEIERYMVEEICPACRGARLKPEILAVKFLTKNISAVAGMSIKASQDFFNGIKKNDLSPSDQKIVSPIIKEVLNRLEFLLDVGLDYLTLSRSSATLSGGEAQRIRLATQIGSGLTGVLYILDEPSIGLHTRDQARLIKTLKHLRDLGNSVIVVEHDEQTIANADWVVDVGPGAGKHGGRITFEGTPAQLKKSDTITGQYLSGRKRIEIPNNKVQITNKSQSPNVKSQNFLIIKNAAENNLKNITAKIPLGLFVAVTGVSGSGKSSLVNDILAKFLLQKFYDAKDAPGKFTEIVGWENLDKVVVVDQSPIGRTPRSNPATYTGAFGPMRDLFAATREAKVRGFEPGRFSFNVKGGRCEECEGQGVKKIEMHFLPDVYVECEECHGTRYNREALEIEYKGKNIAQVLKMPVEEAVDFFKNIPALKQKLGTLQEVGLGYMELGQAATTLSGGEAQRIKLATELSRRDTGKTLYILDEPTTGLHFDDIKKLLNVLHLLVAKGNTVLVIEHNLDVVRTADWIIDLGPEGGDKGGRVVVAGTLKDIIANKFGYTGQFLKNIPAFTQARLRYI
ncbi:MAG: excinuclease ABC subunit UvrA [Candidatus Sungbacteria bacterium]|uniref:UvrABC system protein A n=1 Tax=Candidatus Sungiibacteriota bacterium TaxID=2750080 RepID=A0A931YDA1_9BACT|nr:excinuclease ABC subunit UvrA [Candidatus Sungbacteria bacterium]